MKHQELECELSLVVDQLQPSEVSILDLGCGDAWLIERVFRDRLVSRFIGIDLSEPALDKADDRLKPLGWDVELLHGNYEEVLPALESNSINFLLASYSMHHFSDSETKQRILNECRRILTEEGVMVLVDIYCREKESREDYMLRFDDFAKREYTVLEPDDFEIVMEHINGYDFPESLSMLGSMAERAGFRSSTCLFSDDFHAFLRLDGVTSVS